MNVAFDHFIGEIEALPNYKRAVAADPTFVECLEALRTAFAGLERLADTNTKALELLDRATAIVKSGGPWKPRFVRVYNVLAETSRIFDPAGGTPDLALPASA
jgi:hypothetical protein